MHRANADTIANSPNIDYIVIYSVFLNNEYKYIKK